MRIIQTYAMIALETLVLGNLAHHLADTEVTEDFLCTAENGVKLLGALELLDKLAHTGLGETTTTKDLDGVVRNLAGDASAHHLEETNLAGKVGRLLLVAHVAHLVGDSLEPGLHSLDLGDHVREPFCQFKHLRYSLLTDDGLGEERLAKDVTLGSPLDALLDNDTRAASRATAHGPTLVVKVGEDDKETTVLGTEHVVLGNDNVLELNVGGTGGSRVRSLDLLGLDTLAAGDEEDGETTLGAASDGEVVGVHTASDPLLGTVDGPGAVAVIGGSAAETLDVGSSKGLGNGKTDCLFSGENLLHDLGAKGLLGKVHNWGETNDHTTVETVGVTTGVNTSELLSEDELMEVVELFALDAAQELEAMEVLAGAETHGVDTVGAHSLEDKLGSTLAVLLAELGIGVDDLINVLASSELEAAVGVVVVRRFEDGGEPRRLGIRNAGEVSGLGDLDLGLLALDLADTETLVLGLEEDFLAMETKEDGSRVLTG